MTDAYIEGLEVRRQVMGDEFVDKAFANVSEFSRPLQDFISCRGTYRMHDGTI